MLAGKCIVGHTDGLAPMDTPSVGESLVYLQCFTKMLSLQVSHLLVYCNTHLALLMVLSLY